MSYTSGEALILTRLQAVSGSVWTSTNTARGKWGLLNSGDSDHYAILKMGAGTNDGLSISTTLRSYTTVIEVWKSYTDDGTSYTNMLAYHEAILDMFDQYRKLGDTGGTISDARCARWDAVEEMWTRDGGPRWLRQNFYIEWDEENAVVYAE
jgi:hypothetical protein